MVQVDPTYVGLSSSLTDTYVFYSDPVTQLDEGYAESGQYSIAQIQDSFGGGMDVIGLYTGSPSAPQTDLSAINWTSGSNDPFVDVAITLGGATF